ncbi:hypothetical protein B296_00022402 [Ensete ventricosum]|uniref:Uncharacterized protein n=1 Tax=Ensete ventricosum TaxID=4639 RepID=A0A427ARV4_ENSVE|nr:hypothetical protein B296_00022402 [Ensete ventricosum]
MTTSSIFDQREKPCTLLRIRIARPPLRARCSSDFDESFLECTVSPDTARSTSCKRVAQGGRGEDGCDEAKKRGRWRRGKGKRHVKTPAAGGLRRRWGKREGRRWRREEAKRAAAELATAKEEEERERDLGRARWRKTPTPFVNGEEETAAAAVAVRRCRGRKGESRFAD